MAKPPKNHPWKLGLSGPVSYNRNSQSKWRGFYRPPEADSPVRSLSASEIEELGLAPSECAMVGDRLYTDMEMAIQAGCVSVLVLLNLF